MKCDVVIVGDGPAGSVTAYHLRESGLSVVLIDRLGDEQFARYHTICGSAVSSHGTRRIGLREDEVRNHIDRLKIRFPGDRCLDIRSKGYVIDRPALLKRLRYESVQSGVRFMRGSVVSVRETYRGYEVVLKDGTEIESKYVVGADGCYSIVRRQLFRSEPEIMLKVEEWHSPGSADDHVLEFIMSEHASQLYSWIFPYGDHICTGSLPTGKSVGEGSVRGVRTIPLGHVKRICKDNAFLVGDAAGLPNPMTAGGISAAFISAYHAARAIINDHPDRYQKWWNHCLASDRRFLEVHNTISSFSDEELLAFSDRFNHKGIWLNGISSVFHHPKYLRLYIGCLMSLRFGW